MRAFVDKNVLIRHLTGEPPAQARRATRLLTESEELLLPDLIVAEGVHVLESFYEVPRAEGRGWRGPSWSTTANVKDFPMPEVQLEHWPSE